MGTIGAVGDNMRSINPITLTKFLAETTTPTAIANVAQIYSKNDNELYFQSGAGVEHYVQTAPYHLNTYKSYSFRSPTGASGTYYIAGYYKYEAADANLDQGQVTKNFGSANVAYGAHAFLVASGAGTASGGSGAVTITVSGTSIDDDGTRTPTDSETLVADITAMSTDEYFETTKKWIGVIVYTLDVGATGHTAYAADFNIGTCKYEDFGNKDFTVTNFETVGRAGANDSGFDVILYKHDDTSWTYSAAAFEPTPTVICRLQTDYNTEYQLSNNEYFAYKRANLSTTVTGSGAEGVIAVVTTTANAAVDSMDAHIGVHF